jgi:protein CpxP
VVGRVSKNKFLLFLVSALLLINVGLLVSFVWKKDKPRPPVSEQKSPRQMMSDFMLNDLKFTPEQKEKADKHLEQHRERMRKLFDEQEKAKIEFFSLVYSGDSPSDSAISIGAQKIGDKQKEIELTAFSRFRTIRGFCTPEQLPRFDSLFPEVVRKIIAYRKNPGRPKGDSTNK